MKKNLILLLFVISTFVGCSHDEEMIYSCDKAVNEWTIDNLTFIQKMTRKDWLVLSKAEKRAAYRAFTQQQRINFWLDKLQEVKSLNWSIEEIHHIEKVESFIKDHTEFMNNKKLSDEELDILEKYFYMWLEEGKSVYGWTDNIGISIAGSGEVAKNTKGELFDEATEYNNDSDLTNRGGEECECNQSVFSDFCGGAGPCVESKCTEQADGCGWLFLQQCNGICYRVDYEQVLE